LEKAEKMERGKTERKTEKLNKQNQKLLLHKWTPTQNESENKGKC
jgi:hypothetical protein